MASIRLNETNGLYKFAKGMVKSGLEMYLDNRTGRVSIHVHDFVDGFDAKRFNLKIANYISSHMLLDTYKTVGVYTF